MEQAWLERAWMESPVGRLELAADAEGLRRVEFALRAGQRHGAATPEGAGAAAGRGQVGAIEAAATSIAARPRATARRMLAAARLQLEEYFAGRRTTFDVPLAPQGTPFQLQVWEELRRIAYGQTIPYGELARRVGRPRAARAVGAANGANPIPIIVPCHRVIGANGNLTGFGGGLETKAELLALESAQLRLDQR